MIDNDYSDVIFADSWLEKNYKGEHANIAPPEKEKKPLTIRESLIYEYMRSHPKYTMPEVCRQFNICQADYIKIKRRIANKGWPINGVISKQTHTITYEWMP